MQALGEVNDLDVFEGHSKVKCLGKLDDLGVVEGQGEVKSLGKGGKGNILLRQHAGGCPPQSLLRDQDINNPQIRGSRC